MRRLLAQTVRGLKERHVLAADVDPDANLGLALGFDEETLDCIVPISRMRKLVEETNSGNSPTTAFILLNPEGR